jgi:hypothetical protein
MTASVAIDCTQPTLDGVAPDAYQDRNSTDIRAHGATDAWTDDGMKGESQGGGAIKSEGKNENDVRSQEIEIGELVDTNTTCMFPCQGPADVWFH